MTTEDIVMVIDKPHFVVKLHTTLLQVNLKEGIRKELEDVIEAKPILRDSLGLLFQTVIPLDVHLKDIQSVSINKKGQVKIAIPSRKDLVIPLDQNESRTLIDKLNELIPIEKERARMDQQESDKTEREFEPQREMQGEQTRERYLER
jgi:hypothetical protein